MANGNDSAFPWDDKNGDGSHYHAHSGMTKREYFAALAMQGMLANPTGDAVYASSYAKAAVTSADALLDELAKEK